jgi:hypothetical protein
MLESAMTTTTRPPTQQEAATILAAQNDMALRCGNCDEVDPREFLDDGRVRCACGCVFKPLIGARR